MTTTKGTTVAPRKAQNTNRQGANFELHIMHDLQARGYAAMRSSGSRGAADVIAIGDSCVLFIQAKITNPVIPPKERRALLALTGRLSDQRVLPLVAYRINGRVHYRRLTGERPKDFLIFEPTLCRTAVCGRCAHTKESHAEGTGCWYFTPGGGPSCGCPVFDMPEVKR